VEEPDITKHKTEEFYMSRIKGRRAIAAVLAVVMMLSMTLIGWPAGVFTKVYAAEADYFAGGAGTYARPYLIETREHLLALGYGDSRGKYYALANNIDLSDGDWMPIDLFYGSLDGRGYSIKNLTVRGGRQYAGLFGRIEIYGSASDYPIEIKNLTVEISENGVTAYYASKPDANANPYSLPSNSPANPEAYAGGLIAVYENKSSKDYEDAEEVFFNNKLIIENVTVKGGQIASNYNAGGLIGSCQTRTAEVNIKNCRVESNVVVRYMDRIGNDKDSDPRNYFRRAAAGGLIGFSNTPSSAYLKNVSNPAAKIIIDCCETTGKIDAFSIESDVKGSVSATSRRECTVSAGGILGNYGLPVVNGTVQNRTHIDSDKYNARGELSITNSTAQGEIVARGGFKENNLLEISLHSDTFNNMFAVRAGGIFGSIDNDTIDKMTGKVTISNCAATGNVTAQNYRQNNNHAVVYAGGFGGILYSNGDAKISKSYATGNVTIPDLLTGNGKTFANNHSNSAAGGFIGQASNYSGKSSRMSITIENCYASGSSYVKGYTKDNMDWVLLALGLPPIPGLYDLHASGNPQAGGLVGYTRGSTIMNCYAWGNAEGDYAGNLVGYYNSPCTSTNNYGVSTQSIKGKNDGYPTALNSSNDMKSSSNFRNWDFGTIWTYKYGVNNGYPVLGAFYLVSTIQITPRTVNLPVNTTASETLYVTIYPASLFDKRCSFTVSDPSLVSIEVNGGSCVVRPNQNGKVGTTYVNVLHVNTGYVESRLITVCDSVIRIHDEDELWQLRKDILDKKYDMKYMSVLLENDIALTKPWEPFPTFEGSFDGQGHVISNVYYDINKDWTTPQYATGGYNFGFFSLLGTELDTAPSDYHIYVRNLGIEIAPSSKTRQEIFDILKTKTPSNTISSEGIGMVNPVPNERNTNRAVYVGGLVGNIGYARSVTIESCFVSGGPVTGYAYQDSVREFTVGGMVGAISNREIVTIKNCYTTVDVSVSNGTVIDYEQQRYVGGLIGNITNQVTYDNPVKTECCYTSGNIYGYAYSSSQMYASKLLALNTNRTTSLGMISCYALTDSFQTITWDYSYEGLSDVLLGPPRNAGGYAEREKTYMQTREWDLNYWDWTNIWGRIPNINNTYPVLRIFHSFVDGVTLDRDEITVPLYGADAISPPALVLEYDLTATVSPAGADNPAVTWSSDNDDVATVDENGKVTLTGDAGTALITVTTVDGGFTDSCLVTVNEVEPIPGITLDKSELAMGVNDEETLIAGYDEIHYNVSWDSSDMGIVTVDQDGKVTGVADGVATITATLLDNNDAPVLDGDGNPYTAACEVTVRTGIFFLQNTIEIDVGTTYDLNDLVVFSGISPGTIEWSSDTESIASVEDDGVVTGIKRGTATVTAKLGVYTQDITVKVNQPVIDVSGYITFTPGSKTYSGAELDCTAAQIGGTGFTAGDNPSWTYTYEVGDNLTGYESLGAAGKPIGAGNYKVTAVYGDEDNLGSKTESFTVTPKELNVGVTVNDKPYDGLNAAEIASASLSGVVAGDDVALINGTPVFDSTAVGNNIAITFTSDFSISGSKAGNYTLTQPTGITANIRDGFTPERDTHYTIAGLNAAGWSKTDFVITAKTGYQVSLSNTAGAPWDDELPAYTAETDSGRVTFYVKNTNTGEISVAKKEFYKIDITAPTGEITVKENSFTSFRDTITFGLLFKNTVDVTITAEDSTSEVKTVEYYLSATALPSTTDWHELTWTADDGFSIIANWKGSIYARITDNADNITIINSDGVVVYTDSAQDTADITYTRTSSGDKAATVTLNGNTVNEIKNGTYTLDKNTDYTVDNNTGIITFKASYLGTLDAGDYTLTISYDPMGESYVSGDDNEPPDETEIALSVVKADVTPIVSVAPDPQIRPDGVTLSVTGLPAGATGTLQFIANGTNIGEPVSVGQTVSFTASGNTDIYTFTVKYSGDGNYKPTTSGETTFTFTKGIQEPLTIDTVADKTYGDAEFTLDSTGGSGTGNVSYTITDGDDVIRFSGDTVTILKAGTATVIATKAGDDDYNETTSAAISITVNKKEVTVSGITASNKTYDGNAAADLTTRAVTAAMGLVDGDTLTVSATGTFDNKNVGAGKTVTISSLTLGGASAGNYQLAAAGQQASAAADITAKPVTVDVTVNDKVYDGLNTAELVFASLSGVVAGDDVALINGTPVFDSTAVGNSIAITFTSGFSISGSEAGNYTLVQPTGVTANIRDGFTPVQDTHYTLSVPDGTGEWYKAADFVITATSGYKVSLGNADGSDWSNSLTCSNETADGSVTFYVRNTTTNEISVAKTESYKIDKTAPEGDIKIKANSIKSFRNTITFQLFFKDTADVEIIRTDTTSGVASIEYQKVASESEYGPEGEWTTGDSFSVTANEIFIVYAKITDNAGNVTIINSDGVVVYTDSVQDTAAIRFTKTSTTDVTAGVTLNGNTVNEIKNGAYTLVKNTDYTVATDGTITFKASYLDTLAADDYTLTISYNPMGIAYVANENNEAPDETEIALTVVKEEGTHQTRPNSTGDNSNMLLWLLLGGASSLTVLGLTVKRRKRDAVK